MEEITFCLIFSNQNNTDFIANELLNLGIISIKLDNPDSFLEILDKKIDFLFLDLDFSDRTSFKLLDKLIENGKPTSYYMIGTSFNTNNNFMKEIEKYNFISFLQKPISRQELIDKINQILNKFKDHFPKRKHIRINPLEDDFMRVSFRLNNKKILTAKVINISLGGFACLLYTNYDDSQLTPGNLIEHIVFEALHKEIDVDAKIINKKEVFIAFKFTHFYNNSNKDLAKYIMKRLSV